VLGGLGTVRVEENTVRACYGGFWLVNSTSAAGVTLFDRAVSATEEAWAYITSSGLAALSDPVFLLATVLARILPATPDMTGDGALATLGAPSQAMLAEAQNVLHDLFTAVSPAPPTGGERARAGAPEAPAEPFPPALADLFATTAPSRELGQAAPIDPGTAFEPRLEISGNQVDAVIAESNSGSGLLAFSLDRTQTSSIVCSHNRIRSRVASGATASLWELRECAMTGNLVVNESGGETDRSLLLVPNVPGKVAAVAVTGNVLIGPAVLPPRPLAAPFNTWDGLNTLMTVSS